LMLMPKDSDSVVWSVVHEFVFLTSSQVTPTLLGQGSHFGNHWPRDWKECRHISRSHQITIMYAIAREWRPRKQMSHGERILHQPKAERISKWSNYSFVYQLCIEFLPFARYSACQRSRLWDKMLSKTVTQSMFTT
jgi:hypothetical protein